MTSAGPPGAKPTTILIGLLGKLCAQALPPAAQAARDNGAKNHPFDPHGRCSSCNMAAWKLYVSGPCALKPNCGLWPTPS